MKPKRIQLKRTKGWRKPPGAVVVSRPTKWGNIFKVGPDQTPAQAVKNFRDRIVHFEGPLMCRIIQDELRGKDLCCWCKIGDPCHADVLLEIANK